MLLMLTVATALVAIGYRLGVDHEQGKAQALERSQLRQAFEQGQALGTVRDRVVTEYVDRVQVIEKQGKTIIERVPVYVSEKADRACVVPAGFVRLHDAAAHALPAPEPAGAADEAPSGVGLSAVAVTTAGNYAKCEANAEQLKSLLDYLRLHKLITSPRNADAPP
nr:MULTISPECIES: hypothetical protein [Pseudomonas]